MDCWGRRPILSFCQIVAGASCIIAGLMFEAIDGGSDTVMSAAIPIQLFFALVGKMLASAAFAIVFVITAELYPTFIRYALRRYKMFLFILPWAAGQTIFLLNTLIRSVIFFSETRPWAVAAVSRGSVRFCHFC